MSRRSALAAVLVAAALLPSAARAQTGVPPPPTKVPGSTAAPPPVVTAEAGPDGVVTLNGATEEQLSLLPGIGPAKARAIVEHRHAHPFRRADELVKVKGIGRKTFGRLRPYITIAGPTTLTTEVKRHR